MPTFWPHIISELGGVCDDHFATTTVLRKLLDNQCVRTTLFQPPCDVRFVTTTVLHLCHNHSVTTTVTTGMWQTVLQLCDTRCDDRFVTTTVLQLCDHRRRKYGSSSPNSLRPISYFGSIWELYVLDLKTNIFCRKTIQLHVPMNKGLTVPK